jgi:6-phosphogluconolactonase
MRFLTRRRPGPVLLGLAAAAAAAVAMPASASASADASPVVGHVYVNDNSAGATTIGAFDRHADGTLTAEAGSPFAGGAGTGAGLASQGALQISPDGRFLIAADAGSNQISLLRIKPDGSLRLVPGGVVSSGGFLPVSVAIHDDLAYVANAGNGGSNYTGFALSPGVVCGPSPARLSRFPTARSPATCCSTALAASSPGPASGLRWSTASPSAPAAA